MNLKLIAPVLALLMAGLSVPLIAEQKVTSGNYEIHYIVIPTTFLRPAIASQYDIPRGKNRALVNVSVLTSGGDPVKAGLTGRTKNLLEQRQSLNFSLVEEGPAIYYLAVLNHADEEYHRIEIVVELPDGNRETIAFQQKMYWEE